LNSTAKLADALRVNGVQNWKIIIIVVLPIYASPAEKLVSICLVGRICTASHLTYLDCCCSDELDEAVRAITPPNMCYTTLSVFFSAIDQCHL